MSTDREVTRIVRSWLEEGANALPDRVLDNVLDRVPATPQRRAWWPAWRLPFVNTQLRIAAAAVAVVVLALLVVILGPKIGNVGGPTSTPVPTPAPTLPSGQVPPGTYRAGFVTYTVPDGWNGGGASGSVTIFKPNADPPNGMAVDQWQSIATVYGDPCHWQSTGASVGPTIDDLATALAAQPRGSTVTPVAVSVGGFSGKEIDLVVPLDVTLAACDGREYKAWTDSGGGDRFNQGPGQHDLLDILDVAGHTVVVQRAFYQANSAADLAELQAIVNSIRISPDAVGPGASAVPTP